jgi:hypothetical protein
MPDPNYRAALALLRTVSKSGESRAMVSVLVRTVAVNKAAARAVVRNPMRSRAERKQAVIDAAEAIRAAADEREAAE